MLSYNVRGFTSGFHGPILRTYESKVHRVRSGSWRAEREKGRTIPNFSSDFSIKRFHCLINWYHTFSTWVIDRHAIPKLWHWIPKSNSKVCKKNDHKTPRRNESQHRRHMLMIFCVSKDPFSQTIQVGSTASTCVFWEYTIQYIVTKNSREITIFEAYYVLKG